MIGGIGRHDLTYNPVLLAHLNGNLQDSSGNGLHLAVDTSLGSNDVARYAQLGPGHTGFYFFGTRLYEPTTSPLLQITGGMAVAMLLFNDIIDRDSDNHQIFQLGNPGTDSDPDNNILYGLRFTFEEMHWQTLHESGAGVNRTTTFDSGMSGRSHIEHVVYTREDDGVTARMYVNGTQLGATEIHGAAPTGGANSWLALGASTGPATDILYRGIMSEFTVYDQHLDDDQVMNLFDMTLGANGAGLSPRAA